MAPDSPRRRLFHAALLLLLLAPALDAQRQGRRGRPAGGGRGKEAPPPFFAPPRPGGQKAAPGKPSAPVQRVPTLSEADLVTGAADLARAQEEAQRYALHQHFLVCDLDGNGWLSLREAEITLALGREEYQRLDADRDGRLPEQELEPHKAEILARLGALHPDEPILTPPELETPVDPEPADEASAVARDPVREEMRRRNPVPRQLLGRYDADLSAGLDTREVERLLSEIALALSPEMVVAQLDTDESGQLEARDLVPLCFLVGRHLPEPLRAPEATTDPATPESALEPVEAAGPVLEARTHFGRLDPSCDGAIDDTDLRALQSPARLGVRVEAVLSALDEDGDGRLSEAEFRRAMGIR